MATPIASMKAVIALIGAALAILNHAATTQRGVSACFRYEPDTVRISGMLTRHMDYGAPGFGEDAKRDQKEVGFYLDLPTAICMSPGADDIDVAKTGIRQIQLVLRDQADLDRLRPFLGKKVAIRGTLFGEMTGHHHTPVLLSVVEPAHVEP